MKVLIVGDFYPGLRLKSAIHEHPLDILGNFTSHIRTADLAIVNLEAPLTAHELSITKTGPALKGNLDAARFLKKAGFNLATLANNHILDYGPVGLADTIANLRKTELPYVGAGENVEAAAQAFFFSQEGKTLAVLNFTENEWSTTHGVDPGANPIDPVANFRAIQSAKERADFVLVITHGGHEMYQLPSPRMKALFRFYVDAGAHAVVNHHPHCTSGYEIYQGAPIFYSLGNFLFDHISHRDGIWNKGMCVTLSFEKIKPVQFHMIHFDQSGPEALFTLTDQTVQNDRALNLEELNKVISDDDALAKAFKKWVTENATQYRAYIEPHRIRPIQALQNRGWLPSIWPDRKKKYLLNLIRCESHRDVLRTLLENETSHTS